MKREVFWTSPPPKQCELCEGKITEIFIDGRTQFGSWANMCESCHVEHGGRLGEGFGQKYQLTEGRYKKVAG